MKSFAYLSHNPKNSMTRMLEGRMREKHVRELMISALIVTKPPHHHHLQNTLNLTSSPRFTTTILNLSVDMRHPKTHSEVPHPEPVELPQGSIPRSIPDSTPNVSPSDESNLALQICVAISIVRRICSKMHLSKSSKMTSSTPLSTPLAVPSDAQRNEQ